MKQKTYVISEKQNNSNVIKGFNGATKGSGYNAFQCGHGVHKSEKYPNRTKRKNAVRKEIAMYC